MRAQQTRGGFTLIELLVTISIIALVTAIISASLSTSRAKARDARRLQDLQQISNALELYFDDNEKYPPAGAGITYNWSTESGWHNFDGELSKYMSAVPRDPRNVIATANPGDCTGRDDCFVYHYCITNLQDTAFVLITRLEASPSLARTGSPLNCPMGSENLYWVTDK